MINLSWYELLIIYCLENGSKKLSDDYIARNINLSVEDYRSVLSAIKSSGIYDLISKYVSRNLSQKEIMV